MTKKKEVNDVNPIKECYKHKVENKVRGAVYYHEQVCLQCLDDKVQILWDYVEKQVDPTTGEEV